MQPFNPDPISDRNRELFGEYMRRHETPPSMSAFDAPISDRRRELYGVYRSRYSAIKTVGQSGGAYVNANGTNWVDFDTITPSDTLNPAIYDHSIYRIAITLVGGWAGNGYYRVILDDYATVIYPFQLISDPVVSGAWVSLGTLSSRIRVGDHAIIQVKSSNAGDVGPAQKIGAQVRYAIWNMDH